MERQEILELIKQHVNEQLDRNIEVVNEDDDLMLTYGCDSIDYSEIILSIEDHIGKEIPINDKHAETRVGDLADLIVKTLNS